jgi:hypothetical protein
MAKKLFNSLIDYIVVAGCDNDTGLSLSNNQVKFSRNISQDHKNKKI